MPKPEWESTRRELIETYRILNTEFRFRDEGELAADHGGTSVKQVVRSMRDSELKLARAINERLSGETKEAADDLESLPEDERPIIGNEVRNETGRILISQFGSARATTLNTMTSASDEDWSLPIVESKTMIDLAKDLVEHDRQSLERIRAIV